MTLMIDVKNAIQIALDYVSEVYWRESIRNLGLEEVEFDETSGVWEITVGFSREWDRQSEALPSPLPDFYTLPGNPLERTYKTVRIAAETGKVLSVKSRVLSA